MTFVDFRLLTQFAFEYFILVFIIILTNFQIIDLRQTKI
jgi:hypothetical protein